MERSWTPEGLSRARTLHAELVRILSDLVAAKRQIQRLMSAVALEYRDAFPCSRLILYAHNHGQKTAPHSLHWNMTVRDSEGGASEDPFHRAKFTLGARYKPRRLRFLGRLKDKYIYHLAQCWERRSTFWDFERRAVSLNDAASAISKALHPTLKSLRYGLKHNPILLRSSFPDRGDFPIPPYPEPGVSSALLGPIKDAVRSAWTLAHRVAFAQDEFAELLRRYAEQPWGLGVSLVACNSPFAGVEGSPQWLFVGSGAIESSLSHRTLGKYGIRRSRRAGLLQHETIRRAICLSVKKLAARLKKTRESYETAILAEDRAKIDARVRLRRLSLPLPHSERSTAP